MRSGVPTVWLALLQHLARTGERLTSLERTVVGGSACPPAIMDEFLDKHGVDDPSRLGHDRNLAARHILRAEGRATTPCRRKPSAAIRVKQGRSVYGVEMRIVGDDGRVLPWDGKTFGALQVRGPFVASGVFRPGATVTRTRPTAGSTTGDVATIDPDGYMQITDRTKDVIKSGGEWISSIDLENIAVGHPAVAEAAVIGVRHEKWAERPLLIVVLKNGQTVSRDELLDLHRRERSPAGGCRTTSSSLPASRTPPPARSASSSCASATPVIWTRAARVRRMIRPRAAVRQPARSPPWW